MIIACGASTAALTCDWYCIGSHQHLHVAGYRSLSSTIAVHVTGTEVVISGNSTYGKVVLKAAISGYSTYGRVLKAVVSKLQYM
jgi:hypothetical protein